MTILIKTIRFIVDILPKKYNIRLIGVVLLLLLNSVLDLLGLGAIIPVFSVLLEDNVLEKYKWASWCSSTFGLKDEKQLIIFLAVGLLMVVLTKNLIILWIAKLNSTFSLGLYKQFTIKLHKYYYSKGFSYFKSTNSHLIARNLTGVTYNFANTQVLGVTTILNEIIVLLLIIIGIALYNPQILFLLFITVAPTFFFFYRWVRARSVEIGEIVNKVEPILSRDIFNSIFGFVDVTITGSEKVFRNAIKKNLDKMVDVYIKSNVYNLAPTKVIETSLMLAIVVIISFGIFYLPSKLDLLKLLGLFAIAGYRIMPSINRMMIAINGLNRTSWITDVLEPLKKNELVKNNIQEQPISFNNQLQLENITYSYPNSKDNLFENYSLTIKKGEVIGLVGPSGAGKTTLMNILLGFLKPTSGSYKIDKTPLNGASMASFYKKIGYVQQQVYLIDGSLAENVAFGCNLKKINAQKLQTVLQKASLWEMVQGLPNGIHEMIGENGTKLSGGQRQRVGIARALYFDAEILFFDEATSSLDTDTEKEITEAIKSLSDGEMTIIIIAHRRSTLEHCDRIIEITNNSKLEIISDF